MQSTLPARRSRGLRRAMLVRLATYPLVCYLGVTIALVLMEDRLLFQPLSPAKCWYEPPAGRAVRDIQFTSADGTRLHGRWCPKPGAEGAVLFCYGSAGNLCTALNADAITRWQEQFGESILLFDYPGYGRSEGRPSEAGCYAAAEAAYYWLIQNQRIAPERIVLFGQSLGSGVAVDLARRRPH